MTTPFTIAIDASRITVPHLTGTEYYARRLIQEMIRINDSRGRSHHLRLYFRDDPAPDLLPVSPHVSTHVIRLPRLWTHIGFAAALWRHLPDVTFVPAHTLPLFFPGRAVVTVHDLGYKYFPYAHPTMQRLYLDWSTRYSAWRATVVLVDSRATASDLRHHYGTPDDKMHLVYPGVDPPDVGPVMDTLRRYDLPERYWLYIGTLQPRKNIQRIVQAYARWRARFPDEDAALVLAGKIGWLYDPAWVEGVENVYITGYVDEADKGALLAGATALLFPSLHEGFGFPALEAMHCGTPVIASSNASLPELVEEAGLLVNPLDVEDIVQAMATLTERVEIMGQLRARGLQQARQFTWERAARQTLNALDRVLYPA